MEKLHAKLADHLKQTKFIKIELQSRVQKLKVGTFCFCFVMYIYVVCAGTTFFLCLMFHYVDRCEPHLVT